MADSMDRRLNRYSEDEVQEILHEAMGLQIEGREFTHDHLTQMAGELGINATQLAAAESRWQGRRSESGERARFLNERQSEFRTHLVTFLTVLSALWLGGWLIARFIPIVIPLLILITAGWSIGLVIDGWTKTRVQSGTEFEREFLRWRRSSKRLSERHQALTEGRSNTADEGR